MSTSQSYNAGAAELGRKNQPNGYGGLDANGVLQKGIANVRQFGAVGGGSVDDATPLQALIDQSETSGESNIYFPTFSDDYLLAADLIFNLGDIRIHGDKGVMLTHPFTDGTDRLMRKGWLIGETTCSAILNIGDYVTPLSGDTSPIPANPARNLAQSWTIDHLAMRGKGTREVTGVALTGMQNGPHRPIIIDAVSGYNLLYGVYLPAPGGVTTNQAANLRVSNCSFVYGQKGIYALGNIYGAMIDGNNLEANASGCIWGQFNGGVSIIHNMLENTVNPINLTPTSDLSLKSYGNYFEYHSTSDYLYRIAGYDSNIIYRADINGDTLSGAMPAYPVRLTNAGRWRINIDSRFPVLIKDVPYPETFCVNRDNNLLDATGAINVDGITGAVVVDVTGGFSRPDIDNVALHSYPHDPTKTTIEQTPLGPMQVVDLYDGIRVPHPENVQNKLIVSTFMIRSITGYPIAFPPAAIKARSYAAGYVVGPNAPLDYIAHDMSQGEWRMVCVIWKATSNILNIEFYCDTAGKFKVAGVVTQVIGAYVGDGSDGIKSITPFTLNRNPTGSSVVFDANDATPSVAKRASTFVTANSSATTITNFDNHARAQQWLVQINDANTTIACAGGTGTHLLNAAGASNLSPANGDYLRCTSLDGVKTLCELIDITP